MHVLALLVLRRIMGKLGLTRLITAQTCGKPPPSPLIVYYVPFHKAHIQMAFCPRSPEIPKVTTPTTLGTHNFVCKPPNEMKFQAKL
jgi:hypothetical protein